LRDEDVIAEARERSQEIVGEDPALGKYVGLAHMIADVVDAERAEYLDKT
jgi:ATP-dependent DNA helicase RecG